MSLRTRRRSTYACLLPSAARTAATGTGDVVGLERSNLAIGFSLTVTAAATENADKLDVYVQTYLGCDLWLDVVRFTQCDGDGGAKQYVAKICGNAVEAEFETSDAMTEASIRDLIGDAWRVRWVITDAGADNASFTFHVDAQPF